MTLGILPNANMLGWRIVTDSHTLKALARAGWIVLPPEHGRKVRTAIGDGVCKYVVDGERLEDWCKPFTHGGKLYRLRYFDGCFKPFVTVFDPNQEEAS